MKISPEYLAGFFDGEGCIDVQRMYPKVSGRKVFYCRPRVRLALAQSGAYLLEGLRDRFGGHLTNRTAINPNQQSSVAWELLNREEMQAILQIMLPHLFLKREQAKLALWWVDNLAGKRAKNGETARLEAVRKLFAEELKLMKRDPQRLSEAAVHRINELMRQSDLHGDMQRVGEITTPLTCEVSLTC